MQIRYRSTNGSPEKVDFKTALLRGQAPDKGLYMPDRIPKLYFSEIKTMKDMTYSEVAFTILNKFLEDIPENELREMVHKAYNFDVPLERVYNRKYIMWLDKGPTLSFKDLAARMIAQLMQYYTKNKQHITILTATSGDTGSAVAHAFYDLDNINVVVLFPENEVTLHQRRLMTTLGRNIIALAVDGKFDDCQAMVKQAFLDPELKHLNLSSANSINIGRLLPQIIQYFYAYSRVQESEEEIIFSVPCGNFGHLTGGLLAKYMGLPVHKFIAATNENDEFPKFLETGIYAPIKPSKVCISNAMNVGHPSNLARIVDLYGGIMDEEGRIKRMPNLDSMKKDIFGVSISDDETRRTIKNVYETYNIILEPHGAVAWAGLSRYLEEVEDWNLCVSFETANPSKFPEEIKGTIGIDPEVPRTLKELEGEENYTRISKDYDEFKRLLYDMSGVAGI